MYVVVEVGKKGGHLLGMPPPLASMAICPRRQIGHGPPLAIKTEGGTWVGLLHGHQLGGGHVVFRLEHAFSKVTHDGLGREVQVK